MDWNDATNADLCRSFRGRANRLMRFADMLDNRAIKVPPVIMLKEMDLVRQALDRLEKRYIPDAEQVRIEVAEAEAEIDREIEEAGGLEAWEKKTFGEEAL